MSHPRVYPTAAGLELWLSGIPGGSMERAAQIRLAQLSERHQEKAYTFKGKEHT